MESMKGVKPVNLFTYLWGRVKSMFLSTEAGKAFGVELVQSSKMDNALTVWDNVSTGKPPWLNREDDITTINMAKFISDFRTKLIVLDIGIAISGDGPRAEALQQVSDRLIDKLAEHVSDAVRLGGMILKWNGRTWDFVLPKDFGITKVEDSEITGAIFAEHISHGFMHFTRLEYHRFEGDRYIVTNKAFQNRSTGEGNYTLGIEIPLTQVPEWANMEPEVYIEKLEHPLFAYFRLPGANIIDDTSPLGVSCFSNALEELKAVDVGFSRKGTEVEDSKHMTFVGQQLIKYANQNSVKLPRFVKGLGTGMDDNNVSAIHEHTPTLLTEERIKDLNFNLSMAGVKCGFSEGVFVLDGQNGVVTATQVEADDRDTIQTIKNDRNALKTAIERALYGADALMTLLNLAPLGAYEVEFNFGDITYNYEEDKANWKSYAAQGWIPKWMYFVKFEGMSAEEAKALTQEADKENQAKDAGNLFPRAE